MPISVAKSLHCDKDGCMSLINAISRPLLAAPFIIDGVDALVHPDPHADKLLDSWEFAENFGAPELDYRRARQLARLGGVAVLGISGYMIVARKSRIPAAALALTTLPLAAVNSSFLHTRSRDERWASGKTLIHYGVRFAGLALLAADRQGKPSLKWKRQYQLHQKAEAQDASLKAVKKGAKAAKSKARKAARVKAAN